MRWCVIMSGISCLVSGCVTVQEKPVEQETSAGPVERSTSAEDAGRTNPTRGSFEEVELHVHDLAPGKEEHEPGSATVPDTEMAGAIRQGDGLQEELRRLVQADRAALSKCHGERASAVTVSFEIDPRGVLSEVRVTGDDPVDRALTQCMEEIISAWRVSPEEGRYVRVVYP